MNWENASNHREERFSETADVLNVAAVCTATRALGPGLRAVVWVQGCVLHCPGCIAPDWIPVQPARLVCPEHLIDELLANPEVTGLTFSGGEPMLQASGLARLAYLARERRDVDIICFSGYQRAYLETTPPFPGVADLLSQVDVLIDGPYIARMNDNRGMRGSKNQHIHYLTDRLRDVDFDTQPRRAEVRVMDGQAVMIGVPPTNLGAAFNRAVDQARTHSNDLVRYERI